MERIVAQGILYDFYGSLLTKHQQEVYEKVVYHDMSLQEIAEAEGISRQAVSDLVNRTTQQMERYEQALGMIRRFNRIRESAAKLRSRAAAQKDPSLQAQLEGLADEIEKELV